MKPSPQSIMRLVFKVFSLLLEANKNTMHRRNRINNHAECYIWWSPPPCFIYQGYIPRGYFSLAFKGEL